MVEGRQRQDIEAGKDNLLDLKLGLLNRPVDSSAAEKRGIGGTDDCADLELRDFGQECVHYSHRSANSTLSRAAFSNCDTGVDGPSLGVNAMEKSIGPPRKRIPSRSTQIGASICVT